MLSMVSWVHMFRLSILVLTLVCGIGRATSFSGPASITLIGTVDGPGSGVCQGALTFTSTLSVNDTVDGYRANGDLKITSIGWDVSSGIDGCAVNAFFVRIISEPAGTVLAAETSMRGTVDADGPLQLFGSIFGYTTVVSGRNDGGCIGTARAEPPGAGVGVPFNSGLVPAGTCTVNSAPQFSGLQGVFQTAVNNQPGEITIHFDLLLSEAHVQAIPEPSSGFTVLLGLVVVSVVACHIRRQPRQAPPVLKRCS